MVYNILLKRELINQNNIKVPNSFILLFWDMRVRSLTVCPVKYLKKLNIIDCLPISFTSTTIENVFRGKFEVQNKNASLAKMKFKV